MHESHKDSSQFCDLLRLKNPHSCAAFDLSAQLGDGRRSALIVVDVQRCWYSDSPGGLARAAFPLLPDRTAALLTTARLHEVRVVHVRANYERSPHVATMRRLNPSLNTVPILPEPEAWAKEIEGELVVMKSTFDGFFRTELEACLLELGVTRVLVCGLITSACVLSTALGAFHRGFDVLLVEDCCADRSLARHQATVAMYDQYCFRSVSTRSICEMLPHMTGQSGAAATTKAAGKAATEAVAALEGSQLPTRFCPSPLTVSSDVEEGEEVEESEGEDVEAAAAPEPLLKLDLAKAVRIRDLARTGRVVGSLQTAGIRRPSRRARRWTTCGAHTSSHPRSSLARRAEPAL